MMSDKPCWIEPPEKLVQRQCTFQSTELATSFEMRAPPRRAARPPVRLPTYVWHRTDSSAAQAEPCCA